MSAIAETAGFMSMRGQGYYSKSTTGAKDVIDGAADLVLNAIPCNISNHVHIVEARGIERAAYVERGRLRTFTNSVSQ